MRWHKWTEADTPLPLHHSPFQWLPPLTGCIKAALLPSRVLGSLSHKLRLPACFDAKSFFFPFVLASWKASAVGTLKPASQDSLLSCLMSHLPSAGFNISSIWSQPSIDSRSRRTAPLNRRHANVGTYCDWQCETRSCQVPLIIPQGKSFPRHFSVYKSISMLTYTYINIGSLKRLQSSCTPSEKGP